MVRNIGEQTWFAEDAKFFKDVYVYGTLYYDFEGLGDNLIVDDLTVNRNLSVGENSSLNKLTVSGSSLFGGNSQFTNSVSFDSTIYVGGSSTFDGPITVNNQLNVESIDVGVATVRELLELRNEDGTLHVAAHADGAYAGKIGIGSQFPEQKLDIAGSVKIDEDIYDSANFKGGDSGYFLSRDAAGIRWIFVPPDALTEGFFVQNEGVQVGPGSFTTMNFIGTRSGQDLVTGKVNPSDTQVVDVYIKDIWNKTGSGIHTSSNVGIKNSSPQFALDIDGTLNATGNVTFSNNLTVSVDLDVDGHTELDDLNVSGFSTFQEDSLFEKSVVIGIGLSVAGISTFADNIDADGDLDVDGHTELDDLNVSGFSTFQENSLFQKELVVGLGLTVGGATTIHDNLKVDGTSVFESSIELNSTLIDINGSVAAGKTDYRLASVGTGVSWRPPGVQTKNILYVTKDGNDNNTGLLEGDAKATIGGAAAVAQDGDTIYVRPGTYFENNPIGLRTDVSISGQDLRLVTVVPRNPTQDLFHVRRGCLIENMNFAGNNVSVAHTGAGCVAFPPTGSATQNSGYVAAGPANEGPSGRWRSPYVRNCTNFMSDSIGMKIDGNHVDAAFTGTNNLGQDLKSMVCDSFTQYNQNGIGVSITNRAYAQLVSIFTINCDIAIFTASGGQCDLTNSNSSFGNFGLYADGTSGDEFVGITTGGTVAAEEDSYELLDVKDNDNNFRKPFDGQGLFFKINLDDYPDTGTKTGIVTEPLRTIRSINVTNGGSGYSVGAPPLVTISQPFGPEGILAELSANISDTGSVSSIDIISSGRNFLPAGSGSNQQDIVITISSPPAGGTQATAEAITDPILYTINTATEPTNVGLTTITLNEFVPYSVNENVNVSLRRLSRIITSSHSFEYIGAGTDINSANPFQGGVPIPENEIVAINGGQVPFTSTDQKGNFRIGQGLTIDQTTSTISGRDFNRAIQANLTPLILALGG